MFVGCIVCFDCLTAEKHKRTYLARNALTFAQYFADVSWAAVG